MTTLVEILERWQADTDKGTVHTYGEPYEHLLAPYRADALLVLEIGVAGGGSLRVWADYFERADIIGLEKNERAAYNDPPRIETVTGDQADPELLDYLVSLGPYDVIIDDGSHDVTDQARSLVGLWPGLRPGGLYVIEDIQRERHIPPLALLVDGAHEVYRGGATYDDTLLIIRKPMQ